MTPIEPEVSRMGIVPVVVASGADEGIRIADALRAGGLPIAEITFRVEGAHEALRAIARERPDVLIGAGTVISVDQVDLAADCGARFLVSPGTSESVVDRARVRGLPIVPGVATATEVMKALDLGLTTLKFFPAATLGGTAGLQSLAAPFPQMRFIPTGGIGPDAAAEWLALPNVLAVGGSWLVDRRLVTAANWAEITERASNARALVIDGRRERGR